MMMAAVGLAGRVSSWQINRRAKSCPPKIASPAKRGRKPTWRDGNLEQAKKLAALGLTEAEMADFFGVSSKTFTRWKLSNAEFCRALKAGKEIADARVERRLYERAVGYSVEIEKIFCSGGKVTRVQTVETPPARHHGLHLLAQ
jgi:hypothetical protein